MFTKTLTTLLLAGTMAGAAFASSDVKLSDDTTAQIRQILAEQGYEVGKIKIEDGLYEAYARKDGHKYEVFLDADLAVVRTENDD
ncbi:Peptidase propeptide and YPEB domain-containing protein [Palleronia salina]|uniref:Peptidase propeptide and YPEB domain-containing protein n=1 Tax=Palleronia salina TaxID=313368 RepID=A0A1M6HR01_9RHOB|nr:PepSY domain-containing protein [Palleronia salina]SHJ24635.1 Peptidase propeptide and YPEB domain-containing protein [Palleronia salina]